MAPTDEKGGSIFRNKEDWKKHKLKLERRQLIATIAHAKSGVKIVLFLFFFFF